MYWIENKFSATLSLGHSSYLSSLHYTKLSLIRVIIWLNGIGKAKYFTHLNWSTLQTIRKRTSKNFNKTNERNKCTLTERKTEQMLVLIDIVVSVHIENIMFRQFPTYLQLECSIQGSYKIEIGLQTFLSRKWMQCVIKLNFYAICEDLHFLKMTVTYEIICQLKVVITKFNLVIIKKQFKWIREW